MTAPPPPPGRRGNGLPAPEWGALVDLDPRLSAALLDRLAGAGVGAYVEPAPGRVEGWTRATVMAPRPLDRLWVDATRAEAARTVVTAEVEDLTALLQEEEPGVTPEGLVRAVPRDATGRVLEPPRLPGAPGRASAADDEEFRRIVERFDDGGAQPVAPWPAQEDVDDPRPRRLLRRRDDAPAEDVASGEEAAGLPDWVEPEALQRDPDEPVERYVPPPPPPVGRLTTRTLGGVAAIVVGLLLAFAPNVLGQAPTTGTMLLGTAMLVGGAAVLVLGVRDAPGRDDGPDDGAVV